MLRPALRQRSLDELILPRHFELRKPRHDESMQFEFGHFHTGLAHDKRHRNFSPRRIRSANHRNFQHAGMRGQSLFHFNGRNVLATADDDVPSCDRRCGCSLPSLSHTAISLGNGKTTGPLHHGSRGFRFAEVSIHHVVARDYHFANAGHIARHVLHMSVDYTDLASGNRPARHCLMPKAVGLVGIDDGAFFARAGGDRTGFRKPIACHHGTSEERLHALDQLGRRGRAADMKLPQRRGGNRICRRRRGNWSSAPAMVGTSDIAVACSS